jgi:hypothetical protein
MILEKSEIQEDAQVDSCKQNLEKNILDNAWLFGYIAK